MMDDTALEMQTASSGLQDLDMAVYTWVVEHGRADYTAIAAAVAVGPQEAEASVERLLRARLLQTNPDNPADLFAVAPETAAAQISAPVEAQIYEQRQRLAQVRQELNRFIPHYYRQRSASGSLVVLENLQDVRDSLNRASDRCQKEVLTSQPGGGARVPEAMQEALVRDQEMLKRGIRIRTLYHHTARFNGPSQAYVVAASALGGQYRTAHELFGRLIVFDRELAFIPTQEKN
ncbi:LuxR family transcriptional regulator, partial [Kitasatospora sp. NPDC048540]